MSEMMACKKMHARIPVATCVGRQTKGIFMKGDAGSVFSLIPVECRDCEAGRAAGVSASGRISTRGNDRAKKRLDK